MQPVIFLLRVGTSLWPGNVWRTKSPVSIHPSEGAGLTPLPPVGRLGWGDSHPELQGSRTGFTYQVWDLGLDETVRKQQAGSFLILWFRVLSQWSACWSVIGRTEVSLPGRPAHSATEKLIHSLTPLIPPHPSSPTTHQPRGEEVIYMLIHPVWPHKQASHNQFRLGLYWVYTGIKSGCKSGFKVVLPLDLCRV